MKNLILLPAFILFFSCCTKDDIKPQTAEEQLTPATQTGANTFSCLLDGKIFKPGVTNNSYQCFYQLVNGEYYFLVAGSNLNLQNSILTDISIGTEKKSISQGLTLQLIERGFGNSAGRYFVGNNFTGIIENYYTSTVNTGELKITKLSYNPNIVSGTFWFDVKDNQNVVHQIRDGRFDMQFTQ